MTEHDPGAGRSGRQPDERPGRPETVPAGGLKPIGDQLPEPDIAPEHDSLTVDDSPIDKPSESDARWA